MGVAVRGLERVGHTPRPSGTAERKKPGDIPASTAAGVATTTAAGVATATTATATVGVVTTATVGVVTTATATAGVATAAGGFEYGAHAWCFRPG